MARTHDNQPNITAKAAVAHLAKVAPAAAVASVETWIADHRLDSRCTFHVAGMSPPTLRIRMDDGSGDQMRVFHVNAYKTSISIEFFMLDPGELLALTGAMLIPTRVDHQRYVARAQIRDRDDYNHLVAVTDESLARAARGLSGASDRPDQRARHMAIGGVEIAVHDAAGVPIGHRCAYDVCTGEAALELTIQYASGAGGSERYRRTVDAIFDEASQHDGTLLGAWVESSDAKKRYPLENDRTIRIDRDGFLFPVDLGSADLSALRKSVTNRQVEITSAGEQLSGGAWTTAKLEIAFPARAHAAVFLTSIAGARAAPTADERELTARVAALVSSSSLAPPAGNPSPPAQVGTTTKFLRDPKVVAYVLQQADGACELCLKPGPFSQNGVPFLEVHHVLPLGEGGPDTICNAAAVCPNCHRGCHLADDRATLTERLYSNVDRLHRPRVDQ